MHLWLQVELSIAGSSVRLIHGTLTIRAYTTQEYSINKFLIPSIVLF